MYGSLLCPLSQPFAKMVRPPHRCSGAVFWTSRQKPCRGPAFPPFLTRIAWIGLSRNRFLPRVEAAGMFPGFAALFARLLARANLLFVGVLLSDICESFSVATASGAVTTEAPQWHHRRRGRIPDGANRPLSRHGDSDAPIAAEVHSFLR